MNIAKYIHRYFLSLMLALIIALTLFAGAIVAAAEGAQSGGGNLAVTINPYENVDWDSFGQYKANFHGHTHRSDGAVSYRTAVRDFYNKGYDIIAITDHNVVCTGDWTVGRGALDEEDSIAIQNGTAERTSVSGYQGFRTQSNGMIAIPYANEQSYTYHIVTMWADFISSPGDQPADVIRAAQELGGIAFLAHPGRYTGGRYGGESGAAASKASDNIDPRVELFMEFDNLIGMELFNSLDDQSRSDRILWDNMLMHTMPEGRNIFILSNDDSHAVDDAGYSFNMLLMPELTTEAAKESLEQGAFYAVSRVARLEGVNYMLSEGVPMPGNGDSSTIHLLYQTTPRIENIDVERGVITITGADYDRVEWIADGEVIHTGETLNLNDYSDMVNSYVRAQIISETGIAMTQPFGVSTDSGLSSTTNIILIAGIAAAAVAVIILLVFVLKKKSRKTAS